MKTLIVDDHAMIRHGLGLLLSSFDGIEVVGNASDADRAIVLTRELMPELIFLDIYLGEATGLSVTRRLLQISPKLKIIIMTGESSDLLLFSLFEAGALAYLHKTVEPKEIKSAIAAVKQGEPYITAEIAQRLILFQGPGPRPKNSLCCLSMREREVMLMMVRGFSAQKMAEKLHLSHKTVHTHRANIMAKWSVKNDVELTLKAIKEGIIAVPVMR